MNEKKDYQKGLLVGIAGGILGTLIVAAICIVVGVNVTVAKDGNISFLQQETTTTAVSEENNTGEEKQPLLNKEFEAKINKIYNLLGKTFLFEIDDDKLREGMYAGLMSALEDPYSNYYTEEAYQSFNESSEGVYYGIGVSVSQNVKTGVITIVQVFKNAPSYESGLLPGDIIYSINDTEVTGMDLTQAVNMIKGSEGSTVKISVAREGENGYLDFDVERRQVERETVSYEMLEGNIGYILVSEFDEITVKQFYEGIAQLSVDGMQGLIIDLRNNPGGRMDVVLNMLDLLLPEGLLIYTEDKNGVRGSEYYSDSSTALNVPLAVLVNGQSASASEIFAGDIQDFGVGTLVGTTTFGKGIVQTVYPLGDNTGIKVTVSKYFTHGGRNIHGTGITPDVEVELNEGLEKMVEIPKEQDNQLQKAVEVINQQIQKQQ